VIQRRVRLEDSLFHPEHSRGTLSYSENIRDVSVRAGPGCSLDMTEDSRALGLRDVRFNRPVRDVRVNHVATPNLRN
jgi:hypothetical protein